MTRLVRFANNATSKLAANLSAVGLTVSLTPGDGSKFPALSGGQFFKGTLIKSDGTKEVVKVTDRSTDTLTVQRASEAVGGVQTSYAFSAGDKFELRLTAQGLGDELDRLDAAAFLDVVNKSANYTIVEADISKLIKTDTAAGNVTITLPQISTLTGSFEVQVSKNTGDANTVNVVRAGTDTINGLTSYNLGSQYQCVWLVADLASNTWTAITSASASNRVTNVFAGSGTAGPFTLSGDPGSKNNTDVYVGGVYQQKSTYALSGTSLTLGGNVGVGVSIEVNWSQPQTIGTPSDGTVTDAKVASNAGIQAAKLTHLPAGVGAVATTVQTKLRERQSLKDFGCVGDGVTDDYANIMKAHDSLPSSGGEIFVPRGSYLHNTAIVFSKRIRLVGEGTSHQHEVSASEFVKGAGVTGTGVTFTANGAVAESVAFRGLSGNTGDGVCLLAARQVLRDVGVFNMGGDNVRIGVDSPSTYNCNLWYIERLHSKNAGGYGLKISEGAGPLADANGGTAVHLDLQYNGSDGLFTDGAQLNTFIGVNSQNNSGYGVRLGANAKQQVFVGGDWEANTLGQLRLDNGADYNSITNQTVSISQISYPGLGSYKNHLQLMEFDSLASGLTFPSVVTTPYSEYTLSGYRWSSFTPVVSGATTAGAANTYDKQVGKYQRIGNMVHFTLEVTWSGGHTGTGNTIITGLPLASLNTGPVTVCSIYQVGGPVPAAGTMRQAIINANSSQIALRETNLSTMAATASNVVTASGTFVIQGSYFIA